MMGTLLLILAGGWWLFINLDSNADLVFRFGPTIVLFISAFLLSELIDLGPKSRSKVASFSNITWPCILAFVGVNYSSTSNILVLGILLLIVIILWLISNSILGVNLAAKRLRGITSIGGLAIALSILSSTDNLMPWVVVIGTTSFTMLPDLLSKDQQHAARNAFRYELDKAEQRLLELRSQGHNIQQSSSILKIAREEGFDDPEDGMRLIDDALMDIERILALSIDLDEIRVDTLTTIERMEKITTDTKISRTSFDLGDKEFEFGSLREAEILYRQAKDKALNIEKHWKEASDLINDSELMIKDYDGHQMRDVISILNSAKDALLREDPEEAKQIAESIQYHMKSIGSNEESAILVIDKVENSLSALGSDIPINTKERLNEAKEALELGNATLAKGLADSILREISLTSESMQKVQKALRQKGEIKSRFPSGELRSDWTIKLDKIVAKSNSGDWIEASNYLDDLTKSLGEFEVESKEAEELLVFIQDDWESLRKKLDSSGIGPGDEMRLLTEQSVANATKFFEEGDIKSCLSNLAKSDELFENIRRRI